MNFRAEKKNTVPLPTIIIYSEKLYKNKMFKFHDKYTLQAKVPYFFFRAKVHGSFIHSKFKILFFFISAKREKKIHFFPKKSSWAIHSILGRVSLFLLKIGLYFFFRIFGCFFCIFFFPGKFICHSFIQSQGCFFFRRRKKKTAFSFIQSIFSKSVVKMNFRRKKKKYGTFALAHVNFLQFLFTSNYGHCGNNFFFNQNRVF